MKKKIFIVIYLVGIVLGFIYFYKLSIDNKEYIYNIISNVSSLSFDNLLYHLIVIIIILFLNFFIIGIFINQIYLFYEYFTIGFSLASFFYVFHFNGLCYGIIFNLIYKGIYLVILHFYINTTTKIGISNYKFIIKQTDLNKALYKKYYLRLLISISIIILNDILIKIWGPYILKIVENVL